MIITDPIFAIIADILAIIPGAILGLLLVWMIVGSQPFLNYHK